MTLPVTAWDISKAAADRLKAVAAELDPNVPAARITAEFVPVFDLQKVSSQTVIVVLPNSVAIEEQTRNDDEHTNECVLRIQKKLVTAPGPAENEEMGQLVSLAVQCIAKLSRREFAGASLMKTETIALWRPEHLQDYRVFTADFRLTFTHSAPYGG